MLWICEWNTESYGRLIQTNKQTNKTPCNNRPTESINECEWILFEEWSERKKSKMDLDRSTDLARVVDITFELGDVGTSGFLGVLFLAVTS